MKTDSQIHFWAHMLDESKHASYYEVYMQEHPEDKEDKLVESLVSEFADCLRKLHINTQDFIANGEVQHSKLKAAQIKVKGKYSWQLIPAQVYAAVISRMVALSHRSHGQKLSEDGEMQFNDVSHMVSRRKVEDCLDIICHNTNVLKANNAILLDSIFGSQKYGNVFKANGIDSTTRYSSWKDRDVIDWHIAIELYKAWASYAKGTAGEEYVCDSDNGPAEILKILNNVEYSADDIDLVIGLNKALDVVHFRSDLAAAFIEGGQRTCAMVSNLPNKFVI